MIRITLSHTLVIVLFVLGVACGDRAAPLSEIEQPAPEQPAQNTDDTPVPPVEDEIPIDEPEVQEPLYHTFRGIAHVHSPYSHDACDGQGLLDDIPDSACLADFRAAPCDNELDFVFMTDHPSYMRDFNFETILLYNASAGDELIYDATNQPIANMMRCANGHQVLLAVGFEGHHTMPLGMQSHVAPEHYVGITDDDAVADSAAMLRALEDVGALSAMAHSEEEDLSAQRIVDLELQAMEWYNPHGNFKTILGGDVLSGNPLDAIDALSGLEKFLLGSNSGAHPDLAYLLLLPYWPQAGFDKWREVQQQRSITGILGSDVHQNVSVDPLCTGTWSIACGVAAELYPNALMLLASGGEIVLNDGDRLDSYARIERWLENRVQAESLALNDVVAAMRAGRNYGLFSVFGEPDKFLFQAVQGEDVLDMGDQAQGAMQLQITLPSMPQALSGVNFSAEEAALAQISMRLFHTSSTGTTSVREIPAQGQVHEENISAPGAYHVEIWIQPKHFAQAAGSVQDVLEREYLWLISNSIRILP